MKYSKYQKKQGFFAGKGFYIVLAACVAAVGIAAWSALSTISSVDDSLSSQPSSYFTPSRTDSGTDVGQTVSDVADDRASSQRSSRPAVSSQAPVSSGGTQNEQPAFAVPIKGNIGKTFSDSELQYSATFGDMRLHLGVDIQAEKGSEVRSAAAGTVKQVADDALWGRMVVIDHGNGIICYYCGLENTAVNQGEEISAGTKLGVVGTVPCECADESHIHIAVTRDEKYISPLDLLK